MVENTRAIVIHTFSYSDTGVILKAYTEKFGYGSYLLKGYKRRKKNKVPLHPFALIEISGNHSVTGGLVLVRNTAITQAVPGIAFNPVKSSIAMFLSEWLYHTVRVGEPDTGFFVWLENAVIYLNQTPSPGNFHLWFLLELSRHMGIFPQGRRTTRTPFFNLTEGEFTAGSIPGDRLSDEESVWFDRLIGGDRKIIEMLHPGRIERRKLLRFFHDYFRIRLNLEFELKSWDVLLRLFDNS